MSTVHLYMKVYDLLTGNRFSSSSHGNCFINNPNVSIVPEYDILLYHWSVIIAWLNIGPRMKRHPGLNTHTSESA